MREAKERREEKKNGGGESCMESEDKWRKRENQREEEGRAGPGRKEQNREIFSSIAFSLIPSPSSSSYFNFINHYFPGFFPPVYPLHPKHNMSILLSLNSPLCSPEVLSLPSSLLPRVFLSVPSPLQSSANKILRSLKGRVRLSKTRET